MTDTVDPALFPSGRLPPGGAAPRRAVLELPDGYGTVVYVHDPPGGAVAGSTAGGAGGEGASRLPVLYLHGIQSHPAWFVGSGAELARRGHPVYQVTRRGSGENAFARGHAWSARQLLEDVAAACRFIRDRTRAERIHLVGVSLGGKLLAAFAAQKGAENGDCTRSEGTGIVPVFGRQPSEEIGPETRDCTQFPLRKLGTVPGFGVPVFGIASLTLVAPGIAPLVDLRPWTKVAVAASAILCPRRLFDIPLGEPELFTENPSMQDYIRRDGLSLRRATARFLLASRGLDRMVRRAPRGAIRVPTTLILASRDRIIDSAKTAAVLRRLTADRCTVKELPGAHTLEFEPDPSPLFEALCRAAADS